jgi:nucleotide-binding universal stress UspA family protein
MQRVVLTVLERPEAARASLDAAAHAGRVFDGARIAAMVTHLDPATTIMPSEEVLTAARRAEIEREDAAVTALLRAAFDEWRAVTGADSEWVEERGAVDAEVARHGRTVELLVTASRAGPQDAAGKALHAALLATHRPVLVVPDRIGPTLGRHIAIAWHDDEPATKAVLAAMPFLAAAERVVVLHGRRSQSVPPVLPPLLAEHRVAAEPRNVQAGRAGMGQALLAAAHDARADLVVMGAYAHGPLVEAILGGVTRTMLHSADLPLLMRH